MKDKQEKCLVLFLALLIELTHSIENTTESLSFQIEQDDYPSDSYYYDNYENSNDESVDKKQLFLNNKQIAKNNTNSKQQQQYEQPLVIKQLENNLNENKQTNVTYDYFGDDDEANEANRNINISVENAANNEAEEEDDQTDVSDVVIINAEQQDSEYQLDLNSNELEKVIKTTSLPVDDTTTVESELKLIPDDVFKQTSNQIVDLRAKTKTAETNQRNYLTFLFIFMSIGVALTGLTIVTVLFVKRRSLLLKSKCQIVSKTKSQQNYTTVGQAEY